MINDIVYTFIQEKLFRLQTTILKQKLTLNCGIYIQVDRYREV